MADTKTFDPAAAGFRVATPITRKPRRPSTRKVPRPQYADAVWYSFQHNHPLEVTVPVRAAEDTIRKLKAAARFLERTENAEVRVQISVEPALDESGEPVKPPKSVVKFLGHEPWLLGRRVAKEAAEAADTPGVPAPRPAARHRRTTAATRSGTTARRASLRDPLVRAVITRLQPLHPVSAGMRGLQWLLVSFSVSHTRVCMVVASEFPGRYDLFTPTEMLGVSARNPGAGRSFWSISGSTSRSQTTACRTPQRSACAMTSRP